MEIVLRNKFSSLGMLLGGIALILSMPELFSLLWLWGFRSSEGCARESRWGISGALLFSGLTLTFHAVLLAFGLIVAVLLLLFILSLVTGGAVS
ncbi:Inner membrane protein yidI [Enterobacter cloacae]|uniref:Inner membrane protein yidI n=1 Tax=Enterobacter cloacae TaxID=550 RepID=A0A377M1D7_ENTCL|nr:Inner membrane protein yidI [Enterobacter cloacae]